MTRWGGSDSHLARTEAAPSIATGASPLEVSRRVGHTSASFTLDRYGHLFPEADGAAAERVDALIVSPLSARPVAVIASLSPISDGQGTTFRGRMPKSSPLLVMTRVKTSGRCGTRTHDLSRVKAAL
jgi:hypothetical protein